MDLGVGVTISYWNSLDAIQNWKSVESHATAQKRGQKHWYKHYKVRICKVERDYEFNANSEEGPKAE